MPTRDGDDRTLLSDRVEPLDGVLANDAVPHGRNALPSTSTPTEAVVHVNIRSGKTNSLVVPPTLPPVTVPLMPSGHFASFEHFKTSFLDATCSSGFSGCRGL